MQFKILQRRNAPSFWMGLSLLFVVVGCNATNDNPIDANKMQEIRKKESEQRKNFNPQMGNAAPSAPPSTQ